MKTSKVVPLRPRLQERRRQPRAVEASPVLAEAVRAGLSASPKTLPAALLYDDLGSALFEAITLLPEYEVTRADLRLLERKAGDVGALLPTSDVVELGPGAGRKAKLFLERFAAGRAVRFSAIDVSEAALRDCARTVEQVPNVSISTVKGRYLDGLNDVVAARRPDVPLLVLFLGSNLSNFDRAEAQSFLFAIRRMLRDGDALLLATDLDKPAAQLIPAYDDAVGVTAAFNKNLLVRLNRELSANFDVAAFHHEARWSTVHRRIEMHLVAKRPLEVTLGVTGDVFHFAHGESLWTESSHRFRTEELSGWGHDAGFLTAAQWVDPHWAFAHTLFRVGTSGVRS